MAEDGELPVVGVLIEEGAHNPGIELLWKQLTEASGTKATLRLPPDFE